MIVHDDDYYRSRRPVEDLGELRNFLRFIWNSEKRAFLDRTAREWAEVGLFYLFFFGILFALFALQLWLTLYAIVDLKEPFMQHPSHGSRRIVASRRMLFNSREEKFDSPGLAFEPRTVPTSSPVIWISRDHENGRPERYITRIEKFLIDYHRNGSNYDANCPARVIHSVNRSQPCFFDVKTLGKCSQKPFGYELPYQPCVFIKFNRRFDWIPYYYDRTSELPEKMPRELKDIVRSSNEARVWLSCGGIDNVDKDHIGEISYLPSPGFPVRYFPYTGHPQYLSPLVAIHFHNLTANRLVTVECHIWAKNIAENYALDFQIITFT